MNGNYSWRLPDHIIECLGNFDMVITEYKTEPLWTGRVLVHCLNKKDLLLIPRMIEYKNGLLVFYNQTESKPFQQLLSKASSVFIVKGRLRFVNEKTGIKAVDNAPNGNVIFAFSEKDNIALKRSGLNGVFVPLKS